MNPGFVIEIQPNILSNCDIKFSLIQLSLTETIQTDVFWIWNIFAVETNVQIVKKEVHLWMSVQYVTNQCQNLFVLCSLCSIFYHSSHSAQAHYSVSSCFEHCLIPVCVIYI